MEAVIARQHTTVQLQVVHEGVPHKADAPAGVGNAASWNYMIVTRRLSWRNNAAEKNLGFSLRILFSL